MTCNPCILQDLYFVELKGFKDEKETLYCLGNRVLRKENDMNKN